MSIQVQKSLKPQVVTIPKKQNFNTNAIPSFMTSLIKGTEELKLLTKATVFRPSLKGGYEGHACRNV
jgi:hypothetical protein